MILRRCSTSNPACTTARRFYQRPTINRELAQPERSERDGKNAEDNPEKPEISPAGRSLGPDFARCTVTWIRRGAVVELDAVRVGVGGETRVGRGRHEWVSGEKSRVWWRMRSSGPSFMQIVFPCLGDIWETFGIVL